MEINSPTVYQNPGAARVLSAIAPGLGQIYNGSVALGVGALISHVLLCALLAAAAMAYAPQAGFVLVGLLWPLLWIWSINHAGNEAERINVARARDLESERLLAGREATLAASPSSPSSSRPAT